jgi:phosphoribosyl 1,2-cyclic phosphodiesterase
MEITILGCGSSSGTPAIGCQCATCSSTDPRNHRTRCSAYIRCGEHGLLIDTGPDLRQQALREGISQVDAVLYTHPHADHLNGIDDLRAFCYVKQGAVVLYGNAFTMDNITSRFGYALQPPQKCGTSRCCCRKWWMARSNMMAVHHPHSLATRQLALPGLAHRQCRLADRPVAYSG